MLKKHADYFDSYANIRIVNICGSCGKKAIPLAVLGADVTVFDISEDNRKYALEVAEAANVHIDYEVCDVLEINTEKYSNYFDVVFMEGGILHYFHDIDKFMSVMNSLAKTKWQNDLMSILHGRMITFQESLQLWQPSKNKPNDCISDAYDVDEQITIPKYEFLCYDETEGMENAEVKRTSECSQALRKAKV